MKNMVIIILMHIDNKNNILKDLMHTGTERGLQAKGFYRLWISHKASFCT